MAEQEMEFNIISGKMEPKTGHSKFFNKHFAPQTQMSAKERYLKEKRELKEHQENQRYRRELNKIEDIKLTNRVDQMREQIKNPQIIQRAKTKAGIISRLFK